MANQWQKVISKTAQNIKASIKAISGGYQMVATPF